MGRNREGAGKPELEDKLEAGTGNCKWEQRKARIPQLELLGSQVVNAVQRQVADRTDWVLTGIMSCRAPAGGGVEETALVVTHALRPGHCEYR